MPFKTINVNSEIEKLRENDSEFRIAWDESRNEYQIISDLIKIRKERGMTQTDLALRTENTQQTISRIENREHSPTIKTLCRLLNEMNCELRIVQR